MGGAAGWSAGVFFVVAAPNMNALRPLVLCGPSGVGKSTLIKRLFDEFPNQFGFSVSRTLGSTHGNRHDPSDASGRG